MIFVTRIKETIFLHICELIFYQFKKNNKIKITNFCFFINSINLKIILQCFCSNLTPESLAMTLKTKLHEISYFQRMNSFGRHIEAANLNFLNLTSDS